jgi:hypothetical protein
MPELPSTNPPTCGFAALGLPTCLLADQSLKSDPDWCRRARPLRRGLSIWGLRQKRSTQALGLISERRNTTRVTITRIWGGLSFAIAYLSMRLALTPVSTGVIEKSCAVAPRPMAKPYPMLVRSNAAPFLMNVRPRFPLRELGRVLYMETPSLATASRSESGGAQRAVALPKDCVAPLPAPIPPSMRIEFSVHRGGKSRTFCRATSPHRLLDEAVSDAQKRRNRIATTGMQMVSAGTTIGVSNTIGSLGPKLWPRWLRMLPPSTPKRPPRARSRRGSGHMACPQCLRPPERAAR